MGGLSTGSVSTALTPDLLMSCSTSGGGSVPVGKRGKSGLRLKVPSGATMKGWQRARTCLRQAKMGA